MDYIDSKMARLVNAAKKKEEQYFARGGHVKKHMSDGGQPEEATECHGGRVKKQMKKGGPICKIEIEKKTHHRGRPRMVEEIEEVRRR